VYGAALNPVTSVIYYRAQPALAATAASVSTDLPAAQAANPAANIPAVHSDPRAEAATTSTSRDAIIDPQTNVVVFRHLDAYTGAVIEQVPAQALLRQRAYVDAQAVQALIAGKNPTSAAVAAVLV
jgi:hypothetical protein